MLVETYAIVFLWQDTLGQGGEASADGAWPTFLKKEPQLQTTSDGLQPTREPQTVNCLGERPNNKQGGTS